MEGRYSPVFLLKLLGEEGRLHAVIRGGEQDPLQGLAGPQPVRRLVGLGFERDQLGVLLEPCVFTRTQAVPRSRTGGWRGDAASGPNSSAVTPRPSRALLPVHSLNSSR